jgi:predicted HD phosphohydrolase
MDALTKEKKKRLMQWPKGDLAERLLFAYSTIQTLEAEKLELAKSLYLATNDFTSSNGTIPDWWKDCKEIARKTLKLSGAKNTEQSNQPDILKDAG